MPSPEKAKTELSVVPQTQGGSLAEYSAEQLQHLRNFIAPGLDDGELAFFAGVARQKGLDPFKKQVYAVKRKINLRKQDERGKWVDNFTSKIDVLTGIDGYRAIAARSGDYAPGDEAVRMSSDGSLPLEATVTVRKLVQGSWLTFSATAYFDEYAVYYKDKTTGRKELGDMWAKMPRRMITKCAEALALRKGWPEQLSDLYASEEFGRALADEPSNDSRFGGSIPREETLPAIEGGGQIIDAEFPDEPAKQEAPKQAAKTAQRKPASPIPPAPEAPAEDDDSIPPLLLKSLSPLKDLAGVPMGMMTQDDVELVLDVTKRAYAQWKANPKTDKKVLELLRDLSIRASVTLKTFESSGKEE